VKDNHGDGNKWPEMVVQLPFMSQFHFNIIFVRKYVNGFGLHDLVDCAIVQLLKWPRFYFGYSFQFMI
jgi:hypothetical protein